MYLLSFFFLFKMNEDINLSKSKKKDFVKKIGIHWDGCKNLVSTFILMLLTNDNKFQRSKAFKDSISGGEVSFVKVFKITLYFITTYFSKCI